VEICDILIENARADWLVDALQHWHSETGPFRLDKDIICNGRQTAPRQTAHRQTDSIALTHSTIVTA
jgi:hypothetical protein